MMTSKENSNLSFFSQVMYNLETTINVDFETMPTVL